MHSCGDVVRCYHSPTDKWEIVEMDVPRDVGVDAKEVWRLPSGDTLIRNTAKDGVYMVCDSSFLKEAY